MTRNKGGPLSMGNDADGSSLVRWITEQARPRSQKCTTRSGSLFIKDCLLIDDCCCHSLVMISIEWSEKTQKSALDILENYYVIIITSMM